jgi:nucleoporin p58/p45
LFSSLGSATPAPSLLQPQQSLQQSQQVVPGVKIDVSNIKPTTRFFELHENLQKQIELLDYFIQTQIQLFTKCEAFIPGHGMQLKTIPGDVEFVQGKYDTVTQVLDRDAGEISAVKESVQSDIGDARRALAAIETLKLPAQFQYSIGYAAPHDKSSNDNESNAFASTDLTPYFEEQIKDLENKLQGFGQQLGEIEAHLRTVDSSATEQAHKLLRRQAGEDPSKERVQELGNAMRIFEDAVFRVASKVGEAREGVIECTMGKSTVNGSGRSPRKGR